MNIIELDIRFYAYYYIHQWCLQSSGFQLELLMDEHIYYNLKQNLHWLITKMTQFYL